MTRDRRTTAYDSAATRWVGVLLIVVGVLAGFAGDAFSHWSCEIEWGADCEIPPGTLTPLFYLFAIPFVLAGAWMLLKSSKW